MIQHNKLKQQNTVNYKLDIENLDSSPVILEDDRDLEELMNMSMVTDRQNNLMLQSIASSVVSSCVSEMSSKVPRKKEIDLNMRPMSAISAVSSLNQRTDFNREELKELGHFTS